MTELFTAAADTAAETTEQFEKVDHFNNATPPFVHFNAIIYIRKYFINMYSRNLVKLPFILRKSITPL